jgi:hypothetical protein
MKRGSLRERLAERFVRAQNRLERIQKRGAPAVRRVFALGFGAALSIGGVGQALEGAQFLVSKDLDTVSVVRRDLRGESVVAKVDGDFAGNSLYKLSRVFPDRIVSRESNLFDPAWIPERERSVAAARALSEGFTLINDEIREQFFRTKIPYGDLIHIHSEKYDVDPALVAAVMEAESRFKLRARSPVGAQGLMQLMPRTGRWMGAKNLYDANQNVEAGVKYLKYLEKRFGDDQTMIIAAYNAGEGNVRKYGGVPPFRETRTYVKRVKQNYEKRQTELREFGEERQKSLEESFETAR